MSVTINTYVYMSTIPLDAVLDLVQESIKAEYPQNDVKVFRSGFGGMYQFVFQGEEDNKRILTLHTRCHGDLPSATRLAEDEVVMETVGEKNTGLVLTIGAFGCGLDISKSIARTLSPLGEVVMQDESSPGQGYFVPDSVLDKPSLPSIFSEQKFSLYHASQIVTSLMTGGRGNEFAEMNARLEEVWHNKSSADIVKQGSFKAMLTDAEDAPSL